MSESQPTGYHESPEADDAAAPDDAPDVTLTTDEESQRDESVARPGND
ncbi:hypothetical protein [Blastococcus sp. VKM Ac-2987]|nr:hypothetical protein [Blastococcus sp. VKM Ac-2987]MCZ2859073.1 hypothetical protein [Blastococcus sp. VKM Ac-2987]